MKKLISFTLLFLSFNTSAADENNWHVPLCQHCDTMNEKQIPKAVLTLGSVAKESASLDKSIQKQIDGMGDFSLWLKKSPTKKPVTAADKKKFEKRWKNLEDQGRALLEVHQKIGTTNRQINLCQTRCTKLRIVELHDDLKELNFLKDQLTKVTPLWMSEEFNVLSKKVTDSAEYKPSSEEMKKVFSDSLTSHFDISNELRRDNAKINSIIDNGLKKGTSYKLIVDDLIMKHNFTLEILLKRGIKAGHLELCSLANQKKSWDKAIADRAKGAKFGLTFASMTPSGLVLKGGLAKLGALIPKSAIARAVPGVLLSGQLLQERIFLEEKCENQLTSVKINESSTDEWLECLKDKKDSSIEALLTIAPGAVVQGLPHIAKFLKKISTPSPSRYGLAIKANENGKHMSVMDLSETRLIRQRGLSSVSKSYWEYVADIYRKRLNLTDDEIKSFLESSKQVEPRTHLIFSTNGAPAKEMFEGGVAMVKSSKANELLPLEKATGIKLPREKGNIAEIVRLVSESEDNPILMLDLLKEVTTLTKLDKDLKTIYVYTSKAHLRLYRKLGVPHEVIAKPIERDVVIKVDAQEFIKAMSEH